MRSVRVTILLALTISCAHSQTQRKDEKDSENVQEEPNKRGFIITPLSALPPSAVSSLLPYLRALSEVGPNGQSAKVVDSASSSFVAATAPLAVDRSPVVVASKVTPVVPVQQTLATTALVASPAVVLPAAPPTVPRPVFPTPIYSVAHGFTGARLTALGAPGLVTTQYPFNSALPLAYSYRYPTVHSSLLV